MTALHDTVSAATTVSDAVEETARQPYEYVRRELVEPDWRRFPGWREITTFKRPGNGRPMES